MESSAFSHKYICRAYQGLATSPSGDLRRSVFEIDFGTFLLIRNFFFHIEIEDKGRVDKFFSQDEFSSLRDPYVRNSYLRVKAHCANSPPRISIFLGRVHFKMPDHICIIFTFLRFLWKFTNVDSNRVEKILLNLHLR